MQQKNDINETMTEQKSSASSIEDEILILIEQSLKKGNKNIKTFAKELRNNILLKCSIDIIKEKLLSLIQTKNIYYIRHAQAEHNAYKKMQINGGINKDQTKSKSFNDPILTELGISQTKTIMKTLSKIGINFEVVFVSPLKRAIQTMTNIQSIFKENQTKKIMTDLIREALTLSNKNIGMSKDEMKKNYFDIDISYISKNLWWFDTEEEELKGIYQHEAENLELFKLRVVLFLFWIVFRKEKNILVISHSKVFKAIMKKKIANADVVLLDKDIIGKECLNFIQNNYNG